MPTLYIVRGLPGSGKSTLAAIISAAHDARHFEADMYFTNNDEYRFDASMLQEAHEWCLESAEIAMFGEAIDVVVSNTFTRRWEYQPYIEAAKRYGYDVQVIECHGTWRNVHGVPPEVVGKMRARWEPHKEEGQC
jgi:predicted kinase